MYGDWLIVNTIPTYLAFSSIGFGNVASNEMTMLNRSVTAKERCASFKAAGG